MKKPLLVLLLLMAQAQAASVVKVTPRHPLKVKDLMQATATCVRELGDRLYSRWHSRPLPEGDKTSVGVWRPDNGRLSQFSVSGTIHDRKYDRHHCMHASQNSTLKTSRPDPRQYDPRFYTDLGGGNYRQRGLHLWVNLDWNDDHCGLKGYAFPEGVPYFKFYSRGSGDEADVTELYVVAGIDFDKEQNGFQLPYGQSCGLAIKGARHRDCLIRAVDGL